MIPAMAPGQGDRPLRFATSTAGQPPTLVDTADAGDSADPGIRDDGSGARPRLRGRPRPEGPHFEPGQRIGRFVLLSQVGAGGMGMVFAAFDPELDRRVAIKVLRHDGRTGDDRRLRLQREAQAMARLSHPNVITVYDVGTVGEDVYIAMEFVDGCTLGQWLAEDRRTVREILEVFVAAGRGLSAAHAAGLVHRDFKPDNVLVDRRGRVRVMDFGLATASATASDPPSAGNSAGGAVSPTVSGSGLDAVSGAGSTSGAVGRLTRTGARLGTPAYMSPEQHLGTPADARSDQFSFCVALYEGLYGVRPFRGERVATVALQVLQGNVRPFPKRPRVPVHVRRAILRGLSVDPDDRFPSMDALLAELERDPMRRLRRAGLAVGIVVLVGGAAFFGYERRAAVAAACSGAGAPAVALWSAERRSAVEDALRGALPAGTEATVESALSVLDAYLDAWRRARREACEDTRVRRLTSEAVLDARMACFDDRLRAVRALLVEFEGADRPVALRAVEAVEALPAVADCRDAGFVLERWGREGGSRAPDPAVAGRLATARAKFHTGRYEEALGVLDGLEQEYGTDLPRATASAVGVLRGDVLEKLGRFEEAERAYEAAFVDGLEAGREDLAFDAARGLVHTDGYRRARAEVGEVWAAMARRLAERLDDRRRTAELENAVGSMRLAQGRRKEALEHYRRALRGLETVEGADGARAWAMNNLAVAHAALGQLDRARTLHRAALDLRIARLGPGHPEVAVSLANLASVESQAERFDEAEALYERALEIRRSAFGPTHVDVAGLLNNLGSIAEQRGRIDEAVERYRRAYGILRERLGPTHPNTVIAAANLAGALRQAGRPSEAVDLLDDLVAELPPDGDAELAGEVTWLLACARLERAGAEVVDGPRGVEVRKLRRVGRAERGRILTLLDGALERLGDRASLADPEVWDLLADLRRAVGRGPS